MGWQPVVTVPLGSPPQEPVTFPSTFGDYVNTFFRSQFNDGDQPPFDSGILANTSYTDPGALTSDDTATYATADQAGFHAFAQPITDPLDAPWLMVAGRQDDVVTIPAEAMEVAAELVVVARNPGMTAALAIIGHGGSAFPDVSVITSVAQSDDWVRHTIPFPSINVGTWRAVLAARDVRARINPNAVTMDSGSTDAAYFALRVSWFTQSTNFPLRRYPPINNGGSGPTRHYPRAVNRRAGGTY